MTDEKKNAEFADTTGALLLAVGPEKLIDLIATRWVSDSEGDDETAAAQFLLELAGRISPSAALRWATTEVEPLEHEAARATRIDKRHAETCRQLATHARERFVLVRELRHQMGLMHPRIRSVLGADLKPGMVFWDARHEGTFGSSNMPYVIVEVVNEDAPQPGCDHRLLRIAHVSMDPDATGHVGISTRVGPPEGIGSLGAKTFFIDDFSLEARTEVARQ